MTPTTIAYGQTSTGLAIAPDTTGLLINDGTLIDATVASGGVEVVAATAIDSAATISSGGEVIVASGGSVLGDSVAAGGLLFVLSGATTSGVTVAPGGRVASAGVVLSGNNPNGPAFGAIALSAWAGSISGFAVVSGETLVVVAGGSAVAPDVSSGGSVVVQGGGSAIGAVDNGGFLIVSAGGTATGAQVNLGGNLEIQSGGVASATDVGYAGFLTVSSGAVAHDATLGFEAYERVLPGGTADNVTLAGNTAALDVMAGGSVAGTISFAPNVFADQVAFGGTVMPATVISGLDGANFITLSNIPYDPHGSAAYSAGRLTVTEGGSAYVLDVAPLPDYAGGKFVLLGSMTGVSGTEVMFEGAASRAVSSGQTSSGLSIPGNAWLIVLAGGTATSAVLSGSGPSLTYTASPIDGGTLTLSPGVAPQALGENFGTLRATTIGFGANMINDGTAESLRITDGGVFLNGGTAAGNVITSSAMELDLGHASGLTVNGGLEGLGFGGVAIGTVVMSGGEQVVGGQLSDGGAPFALADGTASATTIEAGGAMFVNLSSTAAAPEIAGGGTLVVNAGATISGDIGFLGTGGRLVLGGTTPVSGLVLSGFAAGDAIDLRDAAPAAHASAGIVSGNTLDIATGGGTVALTLAGAQPGLRLLASADGLIEAACFVAGTRIATGRGDVPVEALAVGDAVRTRDGRLRAVRWLGWRRVDCTRHPQPEQVWPVRIRAGAFAPGRPRRDLWLSPDHAVFVEGVLIPVRYLVNGATVAAEPVARVAYWHVELDRHDVILAEGLPAESYLDTGNRAAFANGGGAVALHPDFARAVWQRDACAELATEGAAVAAARRRLLARATLLGHRLTHAPLLAAQVDGRPVAIERTLRRWLVRLPEGAQMLRLRSRVWTPAETDPDATDPRRLGVALRALRRDGADLALDDPALASGWHAPEPEWRWTDGDGAIRVAGARRIGFEVAAVGRYWQTDAAAAPQVPVKRGGRFAAKAARPSR